MVALGPTAHATLVVMKSWEGSQWDGSSCKRLIKKNCFYLCITYCYWNWRKISKMHFFLEIGGKITFQNYWKAEWAFFFQIFDIKLCKVSQKWKNIWMYPRETRISKSYPILWVKSNKICQKTIKFIWRLVVRT